MIETCFSPYFGNRYYSHIHLKILSGGAISFDFESICSTHNDEDPLFLEVIQINRSLCIQDCMGLMKERRYKNHPSS